MLLRTSLSPYFKTAVQAYSPARGQSFSRSLATAAMAPTTDPSSYKLNHTMLRIKDPKKSIPFYEHLGLTQVATMDMPAASFTNYFLASSSSSTSTSTKHWTARQGVLELCHNYGSEADPSFAVANGNEATKAAGRGFGHICISVDNLRAACARLDRSGLGRGWQKRVEEGKMREIAFAKDPDGYWVELVGQGAAGGEEQEGTDPGTYLVNHSMIRVKDPQRSLRFYRDVLGMQLVRTIKAEGFDLLFLGYHAPTEDSAKLEGLLELTWNHGTEKQEGPDEIYASGNQEPRGFGHVAVTVDDLEAACQRLEEKGVRWQKKLREGRMKMVAFVLDPDGYWVEILQNEDLKRDVN